MIEEKALDLRMAIARLEQAAMDVGLLDREIAHILRLPPGGWPMPVAEQWSPMKVLAERRLRELGEVCRLMMKTFGTEAAMWLRRADEDAGTSPLDFLATEPGALSAMRRALLAGPGHGVAIIADAPNGVAEARRHRVNPSSRRSARPGKRVPRSPDRHGGGR